MQRKKDELDALELRFHAIKFVVNQVQEDLDAVKKQLEEVRSKMDELRGDGAKDGRSYRR